MYGTYLLLSIDVVLSTSKSNVYIYVSCVLYCGFGQLLSNVHLLDMYVIYCTVSYTAG